MRCGSEPSRRIDLRGMLDARALCMSSLLIHLARTYQLSAYDAAYLELAIRRGLPLACNDGKLKTAAAAVGVVLFSPA
jgi:hypothetical protein